MSSFFHRGRFALDHRWAPAHMSEYHDGELASSGRVRMEGHIGECQECRKVLNGLGRMLETLRQLPGPSGSADAVAIAAAVRRRLR